MRFSSKEAVEYDLKMHYILLNQYEEKLNALSRYDGCLLKPIKYKGPNTYYSIRPQGKTKFQYAGNDHNEDVIRIREHAFYTKGAEIIRSNILAMESFLSIYQSTGAEHINELLHSTYKIPQTSTLLISDYEANKWLKDAIIKKNSYPIFDPDSLKVTAFDGTKMRSRAEALHYEAFYIYDVPVVFELPYEIGSEILRPDFSFLDVFTTTQKIWEHLGNWFHESKYKRERYREESIHRIDQFTTIGYYPEQNLFLSFGANDNVFDIQSIHRKIAMFAAPPPSIETIEMLKRV